MSNNKTNKSNKKAYKVFKLNHELFGFTGVLNTDTLSDEQKKESTVILDESFTMSFVEIEFNYTYEKHMFINELILIELPKGNTSKVGKTAKDLCMNGVTIDGIEYEYFMSTPSYQKSSDFTHEGVAIFMKKGTHVDKHHNLITLNKYESFKTSDNQLAKINARLALGVSGSTHINIEAKSTIVANPTIEITDTVIHNSADDMYKKEVSEQTMPVDLFDGQASCSKEYAARVAVELGLDYVPAFFQVRSYGNATKGLLVVMDIKRWFKENKISEITNLYGESISTEGLDIIWNDSVCKFAKLYSSTSEYDEALRNQKEEVGVELGSLLDGIWIQKYEKEISNMTRANYQLLTGLSWNTETIAATAKRTIDLYMDVLKRDYDKTMIFLGEVSSELDPDEVAYTTTNKLVILLQANPLMIDDSWVRDQLRRMLKKKMNEVRYGKFYIEGGYRTCIQNPVSQLQSICNIEMTDCIGAWKVFSTEENNDTEVCISRNPIATYHEIRKMECVANDTTDKWLSHLRGSVVFGISGLECATLSGQDFDGDIVFKVTEPNIVKSVIPSLPIIYIGDTNPSEADLAKMESMKTTMTKENVIDNMLEFRGNAIGETALLATNYVNAAMSSPDYTGFDDVLVGLRSLSMVLIDSPKTGITASIDKQYKLSVKPYFFTFIPDKHIRQWSENEREMSPLSNFASKLTEYMGANFWEFGNLKSDEQQIRDKINLKTANELLINQDFYSMYEDDILKIVCDWIEETYQTFSSKRRALKLNFKQQKDIINDMSGLDGRDKFNAMQLAEKEHKSKMDLLMLETQEVFDNKFNEEQTKAVVATLTAKMFKNKRSISFIYNFLFEGAVKNIIDNTSNQETVEYYENSEGDIEYLDKRYSKRVISNMTLESAANASIQKKGEIMNRIEKSKREFVESFKTRIKCAESVTTLEDGIYTIQEHIQQVGDKTYHNVGLFQDGDYKGFIYADRTKIDNITDLFDFLDSKVELRVNSSTDKNVDITLSRVA